VKTSLLSNDFEIICMDKIEAEEVKWLWSPYIPLGKITILQGDPGLGKTFFAIQLAAIVSNGDCFPFSKDSKKKKARNVIFQTAEDGLADTIKARLDTAGANCKRIFVIDECDKGLTLDDERLREAIEKIKPRLVIIDPIQAFLGAGRDMHRANDVRPVLKRLGKTAEDFGCAIILICHQNKSRGGKALFRNLGSIDIVASARSVLAVGEMPDMEHRRAVVHIKSSLGVKGKTILFDLDPASGFEWAGTCTLTEEDIFNYSKSMGQKPLVRDECAEWLRKLLSNSPMYESEIRNAAKEKGFAKITVYRAKKELGVICKKEKGKNGKWVWEL